MIKDTRRNVVTMNEKEYYNLIKPYEDAMQMILSRLDTLNHTLYESSAMHLVPIHNIQSRIKSKKSIEDKLIKKEKKPSKITVSDVALVLAILNFLFVLIAGARVICYFVNDIYNLVEILKSQTDLIVMKERDYIAGPKPNGYRSYHIILGIPVYCLDGMEYFPVEIQFRTMSMDFWASMEHRINYKKERQDREKLVKELKEHARKLEKIEKSFEKYSENIQNTVE